MTVKCLPKVTKEYIAGSFVAKAFTINELADTFDCSRRTIIRVLQEQKIDPGLRKRTVKAKLAPMPNLEDMSGFPIMPTKLVPGGSLGSPIIMIEPLPWWKRAANTAKYHLIALGRVFA